MAAILAGNNVEEEFMWSCTLTGSNKEYSWDPAVTETGVKEGEEKEGEKEALRVKPGHRLLIKSAILMPTAKKDEVTVIQIESEGYNKQKVIVPFVAMKGGSDLHKYVDLLVPGPAKLKIIHGEGPINLVGSHVVDYFGFKDEEEEEEGDTENEGMETEEVNEKGDKKITTSKDGKKTTPTKEDSGKKASPAKEASEKAEKKTPTKEDSKKRKASSEANSAEKKAKS